MCVPESFCASAPDIPLLASQFSSVHSVPASPLHHHPAPERALCIMWRRSCVCCCCRRRFFLNIAGIVYRALTAGHVGVLRTYPALSHIFLISKEASTTYRHQGGLVYFSFFDRGHSGE